MKNKRTLERERLLGGTDIYIAAGTTIAECARRNRPLIMNFNGIKLKINKRLSRDHVVRQFWEMSDARHRRYAKLPEVIAEKAAWADRVKRDHDAATAAIASLPGLVAANNLDHLIGWLHHFTEAAQMRFDVNKATKLRSGGWEWVCLLFESAGYKQDDEADQPPDYYNTRPRMGRYIIGQAISCMRMNMPPMEILTHFSRQYFALPEDGSAPSGET